MRGAGPSVRGDNGDDRILFAGSESDARRSPPRTLGRTPATYPEFERRETAAIPANEFAAILSCGPLLGW